MMNKHIRMMIDEIFADMKMTADNLALRDELLANAQERYEDAIAGGRTEDEAFIEVAASLGDVQALLEEMNAAAEAEKPETAQAKEHEDTEAAAQEDAGEEAGETAAGEASQQEEKAEGPIPGTTDLGDALNKAFAALEGFGQSIMPEAKKFVRQVDEATGGMIKEISRAAQKGIKDAQKAAEEAIDKLSGDKGELVFDFGAKQPAQQAKDKAGEAETLRTQAKDLRAQAELKAVIGDAEGADELRAQADTLDMRADAIDQAKAMEEMRRAAEQAAQDAAEQDAAEQNEAPAQPLVDESGEIDEEAFADAVEKMAREAEDAAQQAQEAEYTVRDADEPVSGAKRFPAAGLRTVEIQLDADDVHIGVASGNEIVTLWEAENVDGEPVVTRSGHTLSVCRKNPDVFKTFFSVFKKAGGSITVLVPRGYAADYRISTTSGDVFVTGVDAGDMKITTTSGSVRVEPDAQIRTGDIGVTTVSGHATVSACADDIAVTTVSGDQFISCDAHKVDVNVVSGRVHVEGACDEWEVEAVSSDVELLCTVAPTKKVQISSVHSTVRLALPSEIRGFVVEKGSAISCEIVNEFGPNRYGTCALPIRMETVSGKLMITRL
ncbi:MAG: DUF4097 family beta strand repeat protein [Clostridia bacterium]|nr:DUF4097 family beta strand repeat protein [Clostridia bacterium]